MNHKRIQRLCRDEGLRVVRKAKKRYRIGTSTFSATRLRASRPDQIWAIDFCFEQTTDLRILKILNITDEFTKEAPTPVYTAEVRSPCVTSRQALRR